MYAEPLALPQAKPPMEPVPAARQGFTRDTKAEGDDVPVVICPCCGECLSYDPEIDVVEGGGGGKKKKQHHFWAVKRCGHVSFPFSTLSSHGRRTNKTGLLLRLLRKQKAYLTKPWFWVSPC